MKRWVLLFVLVLLSVLPLSRVSAQDGICFNIPNVNTCIDPQLSRYWEQNGGLSVFGYPTTSLAPEESPSGTFLVQYFERNRFELHPENPPPYNVLLGRLGEDGLVRQGRNWQTFPKGKKTEGCLWFTETEHSVCAPFRSYWESYGLQDAALDEHARSLALFGLPLSEPAVETNATGVTVLTQWFERARFEWHPDQPDEYKVLLGLIANEVRTEPVLVGAGDIASCDSSGDERTAELLDGIGGTVFTAGDNAYKAGTPTEFATCYHSSWGRHKARTRPAIGNAEYRTAGAAGYFTYFGAVGGDPQQGYYSYDLGTWHIIVLNSTCAEVGGCDTASPQVGWLRGDLQAHPNVCTLAYWHHPRFSSGDNGNTMELQTIWQVLYDAEADVVMNGHDHNYERFAPQRPDGKRDDTRGMRAFVVGTGGNGLGQLGTRQPNSQVWNNTTYGVLKLTLHPTSYDWQFVPQAGKSFTDTGRATCH